MPRFTTTIAVLVLLGSLLFAALATSPETPTAIALSARGDFAAVGTANGSIYLFDPTHVSDAERIVLHSGEISAIELDGDAIWVATAENDLLNLDRRGQVRTRTPLASLYGNVGWMSASTTTLFLAEDPAEKIAYFRLPLTNEDVPQYVKLSKELRAVCRTGEQIYWSAGGSQIHPIDLSASPQTTPIETTLDGVSAVDVNERGDAVIGDDHGVIHRVDLTTMTTVWSKPGWSRSKNFNQAQRVSIDENGKTIVALSEERDVVLMDAGTGNILDATHTGYFHLAASAIADDNSRIGVISQHHRFGMRQVIFYNMFAKNGAVFETERSFPAPFWAACLIAIASLAVIWLPRPGKARPRTGAIEHQEVSSNSTPG